MGGDGTKRGKEMEEDKRLAGKKVGGEILKDYEGVNIKG